MVQWAADNTLVLEMREPPHKLLPSMMTATWYGTELGANSAPPTILAPGGAFPVFTGRTGST